MRKILIACACILAVFAVGALIIWFLSSTSSAPLEPAPAASSTPAISAPVSAGPVGESAYHSDAYGYSLSYPGSLLLEEYPSHAVVIGERSGTGIVPYVEASVTEGDAEDGYRSFDAFVAERSLVFCAADGPNESIGCDRVISAEPFTTASGTAGTKLVLHLVHKNLAAHTQTESEFGPIYAFDAGARVPDAVFAALLIYPPLGTYADGAHAALVSSVAKSLTFTQ